MQLYANRNVCVSQARSIAALRSMATCGAAGNRTPRSENGGMKKAGAADRPGFTFGFCVLGWRCLSAAR